MIVREYAVSSLRAADIGAIERSLLRHYAIFCFSFCQPCLASFGILSLPPLADSMVLSYSFLSYYLLILLRYPSYRRYWLKLLYARLFCADRPARLTSLLIPDAPQGNLKRMVKHIV